mmetsp:Transcript_73361/g.170187  ORF Transcript_73361/g.170187 Transcript_73361/m.170187 type:complete len:203 (-) Transcript_73361:1800-2408(-)
MQRVREHVQTDANALVLLDIEVSELRALQNPGAVGHENRRCFSEEEDAVGRGLLEGNALRLVVDELCHELQEGCGDLGVVPPDVQRSREERHPRCGRVLGVVHQPVEEHRVGLAARASKADAAQVSAEADERPLVAVLPQQLRVLAALLPERVQDVALRLHELLKGLPVVPDVHEQELPQRVVEHGAVFSILQAVAQEAELR